MVSEKRKNTNRKWDKDNMRTVSCRLRTEDAELFKEYCADHHTTPGAVLKNYIWKLLEQYGEEREKSELANQKNNQDE